MALARRGAVQVLEEREHVLGSAEIAQPALGNVSGLRQLLEVAREEGREERVDLADVGEEAEEKRADA